MTVDDYLFIYIQFILYKIYILENNQSKHVTPSAEFSWRCGGLVALRLSTSPAQTYLKELRTLSSLVVLRR